MAGDGPTPTGGVTWDYLCKALFTPTDVVLAAMSGPEATLTQVQFIILDGMADDYEDVEQLYLYANRDFVQEERADIQFPRMMVQVRYPLRQLMDEITNLLREGYIEAKYSNDEEAAPLRQLDLGRLHHYWFGATAKGNQAWKSHPGRTDGANK